MDQSHPQSPRPPTSGQRDMVYCHECRDEWYRDEHGLTCPECGSDFTEIIEEDHDPRADEMGDEDHEDSPIAPPGALHPFLHHHPWREAPDPDDGDISQFNIRRTGPGSFAVTGTIYRSYSPSQGGAGGGNPNLMNSFASMLNGIIGGNRLQGAQQQQRPGGPNTDTNPETVRGTTPQGHRFQYTSSARILGGNGTPLTPRDGDGPGPRLEPVDELNNVLAGLMAALGEPPGQQQPGGGQANQGPMFHPMAALFGHLMNPGNAAHGDFVYSQEALDRIISQLMEQNATGNAPPPATEEAINALPKRNVTVDMLGPEGRAECSICMDEVNIGEEVTELPCHHWFHHQCVSMWLKEHDTCPHCRKGIMDPSKTPGNNTQAPQNQGTATNTRSPFTQMPGTFGVTGEGTSDHPYVVPDFPGARSQSEQPPSSQRQQPGSPSAHSDGEGSSGGGGISDRIRRGLFGAPR